MGIAYNTSIVAEGLVFALDAANTRSYAGSGNTAYSLCNNITLSLNNGTGITSSNSGMFVLDGTNDNLTSSNYNMPFVNNSDYTFEAVCKFNTNPNSYQTVLLYGNMSYEGFVLGKARSGYINYEGVGGALYGGVYGPGVAMIAASTINGDQTVSMGLVHYVYTLSKPASVYVAKLYVNGQLNSTNTTSVTSYSFGSLNTFAIGGPSGDYVNGNIAMVKVYNRALSAEEIKQNYNATKKRFGL